MDKAVLLCEGYNDRTFLHETLTNTIGLNPEEVVIYPYVSDFTKALRSNYWKNNSIVSLNSNISPKFPIKYFRDFWYLSFYQLSIGIVSDLDRGDLFKPILDYLQKSLKSSRAYHNVKPKLYYNKSKKKIKLDINSRKTIILWTLGIPPSLEKQIEAALKLKHEELRSIVGEDETIRAAIKIYGDREQVIRSSVGLLARKGWFRSFCNKFDNRFDFP